MNRQRLDKYLVEQELARSRSHACELIDEGKVWVNGMPAEKPATLVERDASIEVRDPGYRWVGRGGEKIWPLIEKGWIDPDGKICLDVGASTGGFTQALLRAGARRVYAVDVGYGQLNYELRRNERVHVMDRYNFRYAEAEDFDTAPELFTMDVSFISTLKLLDALNRVMRPESEGLVLIKPQFEAGPEENEEGVVRDPSVRKRVLREVTEEWENQGWGTRHLAPAPMEGRSGNQEFFAHVVRDVPSVDLTTRIDEVVDKTR